jgi:hypothetical protein
MAPLAALASRGSRVVAAAFLPRSQTKSMSAHSLVQDSGTRSDLIAPHATQTHLSDLSRVAHRPYSCMAVTSRSIASRVPLETIALPVVCTCSINFSALDLV